MKTPTEIYREWFEEVWNKKCDDAVDRLLTNPCRAGGLGQPVATPDEFKAFRQNMFSVFDDIHFTVQEIAETGDWVCGRLIKHTATGKPVEFECGCNLRMDGQKVTEAYNVVDFLSVLTQIGAIPADALPRGLSGEMLV
jgi:ketosteroid isomerase-like protein